MPLTLNLRETREFARDRGAGFCWLSSPGASALALLFLKIETPARILGLAPDGQPQLAWIIDADGRRIDQVMIAVEPAGLLITCHGGLGVRNAVGRELRESGLSELPVAELPPFGRESRFERGLLALLPNVRGRGAARLVLEALHQKEALAQILSSPDGLRELLQSSEGARFVISPPRVQLWGPVNAGKSSLLNALCGRTLALTGEEPGLTRDIIEGRLQHKGFELRLFDAPGIWAAGQGVDRDAQQLAASWRERADLTIELVPPGASPTLKEAWALHSRADELTERPVSHISVRETDTLVRLKDRLVEHFFGALTALPPGQRFALDPVLREDLQAVAHGALTPGEVADRWLS